MFGFGQQGGNTVKFTSADDLYQLTDENFDFGIEVGVGSYGARARLSASSRVKLCGVLIAYASWCGACKSKEELIKTLGNIVNTDKLSQCAIYVIDADINRKFSKAVELEFFPSIYLVDENGDLKHVQLDLNEELNALL